MSITYRIEVANAHAHQFRVTLTVTRPAAEQRLSLPVWIPGSYLVREFARHLSMVQGSQGGRAVPLEQIDKATWLAHCSGRGALRVSYLVYAFDTSVRAAFLDAERGFFNGTSVFLRVEGREAEPQRVELRGLPRGWQVATALPAIEVDASGKGTYEAAGYDELVDHPVELGRFWRGTFKAAGVAHEFVVAGAWPDFDGERLLADTKRICETEIAFWHGKRPGKNKPPFTRYVFMLNTAESGHGGLEHRASTALLASRRDLPQRGNADTNDGYANLLGLISHEYFHTWNVKRLRPAEFSRYDYTRENYTELLWFFEGFTSYYDDLFVLRSGLIDAPRYLRLLGKTLTAVLGLPGRQVQSVAQASFDAWVKYYRADENTPNATISYYAKGSLVALALDLTLRREGHGTLDDVMRHLWVASHGGPITEAHIAAALRCRGRPLVREGAGGLGARHRRAAAAGPARSLRGAVAGHTGHACATARPARQRERAHGRDGHARAARRPGRTGRLLGRRRTARSGRLARAPARRRRAPVHGRRCGAMAGVARPACAEPAAHLAAGCARAGQRHAHRCRRGHPAGGGAGAAQGMAGRLAPASRAGRRTALLALALAVTGVHGCVATALADRMGEFQSAQTMPARIDVAYVRELAPAAPPTVAPAPAPTPVAPAPAAPRAPKAAERPASAAARDVPAELGPAAPELPATAPHVPELLAQVDEQLPEPVSIDPQPAASAPAPAPETTVASAAEVRADVPAAVPVPEPTPAASAAAPALAQAAGGAASGATPFEWPASTRLSYRLTGYYRGDVEGSAQVEWVRSGSRYQVHVDFVVGPSLAPLITRRMTSDGEITSQGLAPRRFDQDTKIVFRDRQRLTVLLDADTVVLSNGDRRERTAGLQDPASQFVQLTYLLTLRPELLRPGTAIELPLALPRKLERWHYDVLEAETLDTPIGPLPTFHLKPRREVAKASGDLVAEIWYAPSLRYLPVRIRIRQDAETYLDLMISRKPELAGP